MRGGGNGGLELRMMAASWGRREGDNNFLFFSRAVTTTFSTLIGFCACGEGWGDGNFLSLLVW